MKRTFLPTSIMLMALCLNGCLAEDFTSNPYNTPEVLLTTSQVVVEAPRGYTRIVDVQVVRYFYRGDVDVSVEVVPDGVTASIEPAVIASNQRHSFLRIRVDSTAASGEHSIIVRATAPETKSGIAQIVLVVP